MRAKRIVAETATMYNDTQFKNNVTVRKNIQRSSCHNKRNWREDICEELSDQGVQIESDDSNVLFPVLNRCWKNAWRKLCRKELFQVGVNLFGMWRENLKIYIANESSCWKKERNEVRDSKLRTIWLSATTWTVIHNRQTRPAITLRFQC